MTNWIDIGAAICGCAVGTMILILIFYGEVTSVSITISYLIFGLICLVYGGYKAIKENKS